MKNKSNNFKRLNRILLLAFKTISNVFPDKLHLQIEYRLRMGEKLDLKNPKTFCEKLQWLKLYNRKPEYTMMVDKLAVKKYVTDKIGDKYVIPVLGEWENPEDIDWDSLPNRFVLKTTHGGGSGGVFICKDKDGLDRAKATDFMRRAMKQDIYRSKVEWPYKNVHKRIFAEQYMVDESGQELKDYKLLCFDGKPKYIEVDSGRFGDHIRNIYDTNWNLQPIAIGYKNDLSVHFERPECLDKMVEFARVFAKGIPFLRTDFYVIGDKLFFGELTFFQRSGMTPFYPSSVDLELGNLITLPKKTCDNK